MTTLTLDKNMQAVALDHFGGPDTMQLKTLPVPEVGADEILIRVQASDVGVWDPYEREGGFAQEFGTKAKFPYVLGSDGAGTVVAVGSSVKNFKAEDKVYAVGLMNPKGGFYAQYAAVKAVNASTIPSPLTMEQAGAMPVDAITALRGLDDTLNLRPGESILIFGASGGIGHLAVQLAKRMGARVFAVASGWDGVNLVERLGADAAVDGHSNEALDVAREFTAGGFDCALVTAPGADMLLETLRDGGRAAYPNGVEPAPRARPGINLQSYDGNVDAQVIQKLNRLIEAGPFEVVVARTFSLAEAREAHRALQEHHLGKLELKP